MSLVIGVDEAGRGPLAGPVVAAAVALGADAPDGLADSKILSARRRAELDPAIRSTCQWGIGVVEADEIDRINIFAATMKAMTLAVAALLETHCAGQSVAMVLVDGNLTPAKRVPGWIWPARGIVGGDATERAISAASILAKQHRDALMCEAARQWPHYGWHTNAGYGTPQHLDALRRHGPCPLHRRSFAPVAQMVLI
jgi:ribonuclease HII